MSSARLQFEGSSVRKWWRACKPNQQTPPGMGMFAIWRPQRPLTSSQHCNLCRASTRCFSHSLEDAKRQVDPRQEALWQLHFQIFPDYDFVPFFSTIRTTHSGMEEEGLFFCNCRCQVPGSSLKEAQYVNDGGLVSLISRPHLEWEGLPFGGHSDCLSLRSIANSAGLRQDVSHILWRMPNVKLTRDKRRFGNCTSNLWLCTFLLNNQDNTLWHGRGGLIFLQLSMLSSARLSFEGSLVRKLWRSCKPDQQTPPGMGMFAIWRPQRLLISSQHCKLCRASARCFSHSLEDAKRQVDPRQEALWQLHFQIFPDYDFVPFFSTIRTTHSGMEEQGLFFCNCWCCQVPGSSFKEAQYVNDGGLVSLISRPHPEWECLLFGGHSDCLLLRSIANSAGLRQDVSKFLALISTLKAPGYAFHHFQQLWKGQEQGVAKLFETFFVCKCAKCEASGSSLKQCEFLDDGGLISLTVMLEAALKWKHLRLQYSKLNPHQNRRLKSVGHPGLWRFARSLWLCLPDESLKSLPSRLVFQTLKVSELRVEFPSWAKHARNAPVFDLCTSTCSCIWIRSQRFCF